MTDWQTVCLATMAGAMVVTALVQVVVLVIVARVGQQTLAVAQQVQRDLAPLVEKANRISDDAARAASMAVRQIERIDAMVTSATERVDDTLAAIQTAIVEPIRQGTAVVAGVRAAIEVFRAWRDRDRRPARDDEEGLFIG